MAGDSFFWKFVPFSYCPGKKRKSKNIFMSFRYNKFKIMASPGSPFFACYQNFITFFSTDFSVILCINCTEFVAHNYLFLGAIC